MLTQGEYNRLKGINEALDDLVIKSYGEDWKLRQKQAHENLIKGSISYEELDLLALGSIYFNIEDILKRNQAKENKELDTGE